jgi:hypothetical protein
MTLLFSTLLCQNAFSQPLADALLLKSNDYRQRSAARDIAFSVYQNTPGNTEALRCYIRNAIFAGHAHQAAPCSEQLTVHGSLHYKSMHVKCRAYEGMLAATRPYLADYRQH